MVRRSELVGYRVSDFNLGESGGISGVMVVLTGSKATARRDTLVS